MIRKKCPVYLRLPCTDEICTSLKVFFFCQYTANYHFPTYVEICSSPHRPYHASYNIKCQCENEYIDRTNQRLEGRIIYQLRGHYDNFHTLDNTSRSAIAERISIPIFILTFARDYFSVIVIREYSDYNLKVVGVLY